MKLSKVIERLQQLKKLHGDVEVRIFLEEGKPLVVYAKKRAKCEKCEVLRKRR